jgi:hypothetical protein
LDRKIRAGTEARPYEAFSNGRATG